MNGAQARTLRTVNIDNMILTKDELKIFLNVCTPTYTTVIHRAHTSLSKQCGVMQCSVLDYTSSRSKSYHMLDIVLACLCE
jgi:hypothetical protein